MFCGECCWGLPAVFVEPRVWGCVKMAERVSKKHLTLASRTLKTLLSLPPPLFLCITFLCRLISKASLDPCRFNQGSEDQNCHLFLQERKLEKYQSGCSSAAAWHLWACEEQISPVKLQSQGHWEDSAGKGAYHRGGQPEFSFWDPSGGRRKNSCKLSSDLYICLTHT